LVSLYPLVAELMSKHLFLGVDGGATSCRARLCDLDGNLLGEGSSGPANVHLDLEGSLKAVQAAYEKCLDSAGLSPLNTYQTHAGLGLAGAGINSACESARCGLNAFASAVVDTDAYIAWLGAHLGHDGAIVILGTGSCGLAVANGRRFSVGGWGPEISDEAGGQRMGREALRRALWALDGRAETTELATKILDHFAQDPSRIAYFAAKATPADYAKFAPLVLEHASAQDPLAVALLEEAAEAAAQIISRLVDFGAPAVALIGGLAKPLTPWLPQSTQNYLCEPKSDPLGGAILMARETFFGLEPVKSLAS
jgi:glucosamine kinase